MPKGRMLNKKISYDEKVAKLSLEAVLLYTWSIPHLDVEGRMYAEPSIIKGTVAPYVRDLTIEKIEQCLGELQTADLVIVYGNGVRYVEYNGFFKNQTLVNNREAPSSIPPPENYWVESRSGKGREKVEEKISKVKRSKEKIYSLATLVVKDLNEVCGTVYKPSTRKTVDLVTARHNEGFTLDDFKKVHRNKYAEWGNDEKMMKYLRPETLYSNKFEGYLNQKVKQRRSWDE